jgi:hypothetical protein
VLVLALIAPAGRFCASFNARVSGDHLSSGTFANVRISATVQPAENPRRAPFESGAARYRQSISITKAGLSPRLRRTWT